MAQTMPDMSFGPDIFPEFPPLSSATLIIFKKRLRAQTKDKPLFGHSQASVQCGGDPAVVVANKCVMLSLFGRPMWWLDTSGWC